MINSLSMAPTALMKHDQENDLSVSFINVAVIGHSFLRMEKESQGGFIASLRVQLSLGDLVLLLLL